MSREVESFHSGGRFSRKETTPSFASGWPLTQAKSPSSRRSISGTLDVMPSQSSRLLIATSHGEGRAEFVEPGDYGALKAAGNVALRYVDNLGEPTQAYPANPNGSPEGLAGLTSADGRVTLMMPHPERVYRSVQHSWCPPDWGEDGPWMRLFRNARIWVS